MQSILIFVLLTVCGCQSQLNDITNRTFAGKTKPKPKGKPKPGRYPNETYVNERPVESMHFSEVHSQVHHTSAPAESQEYFGYSITASTQTGVFVVSAPMADEHMGKVIIYDGHTLAEEVSISLSADFGGSVRMTSSSTTSTAGNFNFGSSTCISEDGSTLAVTAKAYRKMFFSDWDYVEMQDIKVLIYESDGKSGWILHQSILIHSENESINSPVSVSLAEDLLIVGSPWVSYQTYIGRASIYKRSDETNKYELVTKLNADEKGNSSGTALNDGFGVAVDIFDPCGVVGAPQANSDVGAVYVYCRFPYASTSTWELAAVLRPNETSSSSYFGFSVLLSEMDKLYIGAPGSDNNLGAVFVYLIESNGDLTYSFHFSVEICPADGHANDMFGYSLAISGSKIAVGAPGHSLYYKNNLGDSVELAAIGSVYLYDALSNMLKTKYIPSTGTSSEGAMQELLGSQFGASVAIVSNEKNKTAVNRRLRAADAKATQQRFEILLIGAPSASDSIGTVYAINITDAGTVPETISEPISKLSVLSLLLICLSMGLMILGVIAVFSYRLCMPSPFNRYGSNGRVELRLEVEEDQSIDSLRRVVPNVNSEEYLSSPCSDVGARQIKPIEFKGRSGSSSDNPFRRIASSSPANSPFRSSELFRQNPETE